MRKIAVATITSLLALSSLPAFAGTSINRDAAGVNFGVRVERGRVSRRITQDTLYKEDGTGIDGSFKYEGSTSCLNRCWGRTNTQIATINGRIFDYSVKQETSIVQTEDAAYLDVQGYGEVYTEHTVSSGNYKNW